MLQLPPPAELNAIVFVPAPEKINVSVRPSILFGVNSGVIYCTWANRKNFCGKSIGTCTTFDAGVLISIPRPLALQDVRLVVEYERLSVYSRLLKFSEIWPELCETLIGRLVTIGNP